MVALLIGIMVVLAGASGSWADTRWVLRVGIKDLQFLPVLPDQVSFAPFHALNEKEISIPLGTEVVWSNEDVLTSDDSTFFVTNHWITVQDEQGKTIKVGPVLSKPGASFSFLFDQPGHYSYKC